MGHREDLLEGAKRCLLDKGWTATTARDIVSASGANLASIGYHYGSKDELMRLAFMRLIEDWGEQVDAWLGADGTGPEGDPLEHHARVWDAMMRGVDETSGFWAAHLEVLGQALRDDKLRDFFREVMPEGWQGMVALNQDVPQEDVGEKTADSVGWVYSALFLGMWTQRLLYRERAPSGAVIVDSLRRIVTGTVLDEDDPDDEEAEE